MRTTVVIVAALISLYSTILKADTLKIHAIHKETFACTEHWDGQFAYAGDALGTKTKQDRHLYILNLCLSEVLV